MGTQVAKEYASQVGQMQGGRNFFAKEGAGTKIEGGAGSADQGTLGLYRDFTITSAQLLALNATPQAIIPAPGAGLMNITRGIQFFFDYNSVAYDGIASGEDISVRYTDASGQLIATVEATGFLDATADAIRWIEPATTAAITPVANAAVVLHMATGEIATGNSPLYGRVYYDILPSTLNG